MKFRRTIRRRYNPLYANTSHGEKYLLPLNYLGYDESSVVKHRTDFLVKAGTVSNNLKQTSTSKVGLFCPLCGKSGLKDIDAYQDHLKFLHFIVMDPMHPIKLIPKSIEITFPGRMEPNEEKSKAVNSVNILKRFNNDMKNRSKSIVKDELVHECYSQEFHRMDMEDILVTPDTLNAIYCRDSNKDGEELDIYMSYDLTDSRTAIKQFNNWAEKISISYRKTGYKNSCDPADIEKFLKTQGFRVARGHRCEHYDLKEVSSLMKKSKVFIGCLSDHYVTNPRCRMEFQYAKTCLKKPVIPLVVGDGSFHWMRSAIGMLIAGELFIHFRDKSVEAIKNTELLRNIRLHIPETDMRVTTDSVDNMEVRRDKNETDIFLSYCWNNSKLAEEAKQTTYTVGNEYSDPRRLKAKLADIGYKVWLDVERLESGNKHAGVFGQIAHGLKNTKLILSCISDEYFKSENCQMEFQFALKSLSKPVIPVITGIGKKWESSICAAFLASLDSNPIYLQGISDEPEFEERLSMILTEIESIIGKPGIARKKITHAESTEDSIVFDSYEEETEEKEYVKPSAKLVTMFTMIAFTLHSLWPQLMMLTQRS